MDVVPDHSRLEGAVDRRRGVIGGAVFDGLAVDIKMHQIFGPKDVLRRTWRDQHMFAWPPVLGIDIQKSDGPVFFIDPKPLDMANSPVCCLKVIAGHRIHAAQMQIVLLMAQTVKLVLAQTALSGDDPAFLSGGQIAGWTAPPLRGPKSALHGWSLQDTKLILATARNAQAAINGEMQLVVGDSSQYMTEGDLTAIATYLDHLNQGAAKPAAQVQTATEKLLISADPAMDLGPRLYLNNCAACHFATGRGADEVFPELDRSSLVTAQSPTGLITMILLGGALPSTAARPERLRIPGFAYRLSDDEVATLASFLRQAWTNDTGPVTAAAVAELRKSTAPN